MISDLIGTSRLFVEKGYYVGLINYKDNFGRYKKKRIQTNLKERGNKKEAQSILDKAVEELRQELEKKEYSPSPEQTIKTDISFMDYVENYIKSKANELEPEVYTGYMTNFSIMKSYFGNNLKLKDVTYHHIEDFYNFLRTERKNKNVTIKHHAVILSPALRMAYRDDLIPKNPYEFMPKLKREKSIRNFYSPSELEALFKITDNSSLALIVRVTAFYGLRRSEVLGLKWSAFDFQNKIMSVQHKIIVDKKIVYQKDTLKTKSSTRSLPLFPEIEKLLLERKEQIKKNHYKYGLSYNHKYDEYVFVDDIGNLYLPDYVTHRFATLIKRNKLKHIRFHDLRHSCASLLAGQGVPMKNIQEWLGHANFNTTADVYSHLDFSTKRFSANAIENALTVNDENKTDDLLEKEIEELNKLIEQKKNLLKKNNCIM